MKVNTVYEVKFEVECDLCRYNWIAIVETEEIDFGTHKEYKIVDSLECPNCGNMTINKTKDSS